MAPSSQARSNLIKKRRMGSTSTTAAENVWVGSVGHSGCSSARNAKTAINLWERMTKQRPSITSTVMVLDPLISELGNAIKTCTPFLDRVPGELSTLTLTD